MKMKKTEATPMDAIVCDCPYCEEEVVEINGDMRDLTGCDIEEVGELECPHCKKTFKYYISL